MSLEDKLNKIVFCNMDGNEKWLGVICLSWPYKYYMMK